MHLLSLIQSDAAALRLATIGDDVGCAERCRDVLPKIRISCLLTERGLYDVIGPALAESVLQKLEELATRDPIVKRAMRWLEPSNGGLDFGSPSVVGMFKQLNASGFLTQEEFESLNSLSLSRAIVTANQVSDAMKPVRIDGKVNNA